MDWIGQGQKMNFYPRPPRGGRQYSRFVEMHLYEFLPTPSARRATYGFM